jgi:hypothetical protein
MPDNFSLLLGGSIFKIFNDGSNSIIRSQGEPLLIDANDITFRGYSPYNSLMTIKSTGNVGIGTTNPSTALDVIGVITADGGTSTEWNTSYDNSIISLAVGGTTTKTLTATQQDGGTLTASWTDDNAGGTVTGTGAVNQVAFWNGTNTIDGTNNLYWDSTNNHLGINDTTPSSPLKVTSGTTETSIYTVDIQHTRNNADIATKAVRIDMNLSGADTTTADRINSALFIDIDSSANGDSSNEHRIYGVYSDLRFSGFTDIAKAGYFYAESNYTGAKTNQLIGVQGYAAHDTNSTSGGVSNMYGVYGTSSIQDLGDVDNAFGGYFSVTISTNRGADVGVTKGVEAEITIDKDVTINYGTMIGVSSIIDNNEGTVPNFGTQYLFKGDYQGTKGTNAYGIYVEGDKHYFEGNVGIGTTSPSAKLELVQSVGSVATNIINGGETNFRFSTAVENTNTYTPVFRQGIYYSSTENATIAYCRGGGTTGGFLTFQTNNGNERMRIDTNGNVGIGTTNPIADLHVNGDVQIGSSVAPNSYGALQVNQTSNVDEEGIAILSASAGRSMRIWVDETKSYINSGNGGSGDLILNEGAGKVGIGVTDPDEKLEIDGNIKIGADKWYRMGGDAFQIGVDGASNGMHFHAGNSEKLTILAGGNVGIGTTNPQQLLHIKRDATNPYVRISSGAFTGLDVGQEVSVGNAVFNLRDDKDIRFLINGSDVIRVKNTGNVGIGTVSPAAKLHVYNSGGGDATDKAGMLSEAVIKLQPHASNSTNMLFAQVNGGSGMGIQVTNGPATANWDIALSPFGGNVGIGVTNPSNKLTVEDTIGIKRSGVAAITTLQQTGSGLTLNAPAGYHPFIIKSNGVEQVRFANTGNVGIGTTSPGTKLDVNGNIKAGATSKLYFNTGVTYVGSTTGSNILEVQGYKHLTLQTYNDAVESQHISFSPRLVEAMRIVPGGNVGIGTTNPTNKLDIRQSTSSGSDVLGVGAITIGSDNPYWTFRGTATSLQDLAFDRSYSGTWYESMRIQRSTGNVGIGTTNPQDKLDVVGIVNSSNNIVSNNTYTIFSGRSNRTVNDYGGLNKQYFKLNLVTAGPNTTGESSAHGFADLRFQLANNSGTTSVADIMTLRSGGNVGIGVDNPTRKLTIETTTGSRNNTLGINDASGAEQATIALDTNTNDLSIAGKANLRFYSGSSLGGIATLPTNERVVITTAGNVGIGTTNPDHKLQVKGDISIDNESSSVPSLLHFNASNKSNFDPTARICFWEGDSHGNDYTTSNAFIEYNGSTAGGGDGYLAIGGATTAGGNQDIMVLNRLGRVGIGTATPAAILDIQKGSEGEYLRAGGDNANGGRALRFTSSSTNGSAGAAHTIDASSGNGVIALATASTERMRIDKFGNVGIGTTSPTVALDVAGAGKFTGQVTIPATPSASTDAASKGYVDAQVGSADTLQEVTDNGNTTTNSVGIGTTSVTALLNIATPSSTNVKVTKIAGDTTTVYQYATLADAVLEWTCGSYHNAEVVITASQTNSGTYNNLYIRGIWSNNHTSHHWDELEHIGGLTGTTFTITNGQNGSTTNSGKLTLDVDYINGSFATLNIRITDFFGTHAYTIT